MFSTQEILDEYQRLCEEAAETYSLESDGSKTPVVTGFIAPGGVAFGPDGAIYISNRSVFAGTGEVLWIEP